MLKRKYTQLVKKRLAKYPAVALIGPRQSGKTTLAKSLGGLYFDLEQEQGKVNLEFQWNDIVNGKKLIILDEAQEYPPIFKRLRGAIDADRKRPGRFLLLGSVSPHLMKYVSESLAGRMALVELTPFLWSELSAARRKNLWFYGGYPQGGILDNEDYPQWQKNYLELLTARDLPNWGLPAKPGLIKRLLKMVAVLHGQILNASQIGQSLDISYKTVNSYLDYLEGAFLIRRLYSHHANLKKRLTKRPKIYWRDSGLLNSLLNINDEKELLNQPWVGAAWEGFIIEQAIGQLNLTDKNFETYYLRTSDGYEIDLVLNFGKECWAVEIKLAASPEIADIERLNKTADMIKADRRILVSRTKKNIDNGKMVCCNVQYLLEKILTV